MSFSSYRAHHCVSEPITTGRRVPYWLARVGAGTPLNFSWSDGTVGHRFFVSLQGLSFTGPDYTATFLQFWSAPPIPARKLRRSSSCYEILSLPLRESVPPPFPLRTLEFRNRV